MVIDAFWTNQLWMDGSGGARKEGGMSLPEPAPVTMAVLPASDTAIEKQATTSTLL